MDKNAIDVWFGPGSEKGVFGAGVAHGLQDLIDAGEVAASHIRPYGSSIGCLTASFLATGNATCGLQIFQEETDALGVWSNLAPALAARTVNRLARISRMTKSESLFRVPNVLNQDHVFAVMNRRMPDFIRQLRDSPMRVFAETIDRHGRFRFTELGPAADPLHEIRLAIHLFPFTHTPGAQWMDAGIGGYGFVDLLRAGERPLVVVLNTKPTRGSGYTLADLFCAALSADRDIAKLYLRRRGQRRAACQQAMQPNHNLLLVYPQEIIDLKSPTGYETLHNMGKRAARQIVDFAQTIQAGPG